MTCISLKIAPSPLLFDQGRLWHRVLLLRPIAVEKVAKREQNYISIISEQYLFERSQASNIHFLDVILKVEPLVVDKELPAKPGRVVEGEDDWYRGGDQQHVVCCWIQHVVSAFVKGLADVFPSYLKERQDFQHNKSRFEYQMAIKGQFSMPNEAGKYWTEKNQENSIDSLLPFSNFCRVLVKRIRVSRFNTLQNWCVKQPN